MNSQDLFSGTYANAEEGKPLTLETLDRAIMAVEEMDLLDKFLCGSQRVFDTIVNEGSLGEDSFYSVRIFIDLLVVPENEMWAMYMSGRIVKFEFPKEGDNK